MQKKIKNLSVRAKLMLSFASIVLVTTVIVNIAFLAVIERNYIAQIDRYNQITMEILVSNLDKQIFEPASIYANEMAANRTMFTEINAVIRKGEAISPVQVRRVYDVLRGFSYHDMNLFSDVMIYFGDQNLTVANTNGVVYLDREDKKNPGPLWWVDAVRDSGKQSVWLYGNINPSVEQEGLIYAAGYPSILSGSGNMNVFAFQYPKTPLIEFMKQYDRTGTDYYLLGPDGVLLYGDAASYESVAGQVAVDDIIQSDGREPLRMQLHSVDSTLSAMKTGIGDFTLLAVTPTDFLYEQANSMRMLLQGLGIATFLVGFVLSYFLTGRLYRPLRQIRTASRAHSIPGYESADEYEYIGAVLEKLDARASTLEQTLAGHMPIVKNALLEGLLTGPADQARVDRAQYTAVGMALDMPYFRVIHVLLPESIVEALSRQNTQSIIFSLMNMVSGQSDERRYLLYCLKNLEQGFSILMNYHLSGVDGDIQLKSLMDSLLAYGINEFNIRVKCLVSGEVRSMEHIYQLNEAVDEMHNYLFFLWDRDVLYMSEIPAVTDGSDEIPQGVMDEIKRQISDGNVGGMRAAVDCLLDACKTGRYTYDQCVNRLMTVMHWIANRFVDQPGLYARMYEMYLRCKSGSEFASELMHVVEPSLKQRDPGPNRGHLLAQRAAELMRDNAQANIGMEDIAGRLKVSTSHLSKLFREEYGMTPSEYIGNQRLDKSIRYLIETDMRIEDISEKAGYGSTAYYIKKFRERYGVTPKIYRLNHALDASKKEING